MGGRFVGSSVLRHVIVPSGTVGSWANEWLGTANPRVDNHRASMHTKEIGCEGGTLILD